MQVKVSYASSHTVDLQNNALLTWNALQPFQLLLYNESADASVDVSKS